MSKTAVLGALNIELLKRAGEDSFCTEDDWVLGFQEGRRSAEYQAKLFNEYLDSLIAIAATRGEMHTLAYARYLKKRMGYVDKKRTK